MQVYNNFIDRRKKQLNKEEYSDKAEQHEIEVHIMGDSFSEVIERNRQVKERMERERAKGNKTTLRYYRIKN